MFVKSLHGLITPGRMNSVIAIGDIHNNWVIAEEIASKYEETHRIIFMGDYFDNFGDSAIDAEQTARWLKESLSKPNRIHLLGNHDINYAPYAHRKSKVGVEQIYSCSGYHPAKGDAIDRVLSKNDWDKINVSYYTNQFWYSHAGLHPFWFSKPMVGMTDGTIQEKLDKIEQDIKSRTFSNELGGAGRCRGGCHRVGGLLWRDHIQESYDGSYWNDSSGIKQVCGHTPLRGGIDVEKLDNGGLCIDVDCGLREVLEINWDGTYNIIPTGFDNFYDKH